MIARRRSTSPWSWSTASPSPCAAPPRAPRREAASSTRTAARPCRVSSCSSRAQRPRSLRGGRCAALALRAQTDWAVPTAAAAGREGLEQPDVGGREARTVLSRSTAISAPYARPRNTSGTNTRLGLDAERPEAVLLEAHPVELVLQPLGAKGAPSRSRPPRIVRRRRRCPAAARRRRRPPPARSPGTHDQHPGRDERPAALGHQREDRVEVGLARERARDLRRRVQRADRPLQVARRVSTRCSGARGRWPRRRTRPARLAASSSASENSSPAGLVGQVQVAVGRAADHHRHAEERAHRRMPDREAVGLRMGSDVGQRSGAGWLISSPRTPRPAGAGRSRVASSSSIPTVRNRSSPSRCRVEDAERRVPRLGQLRAALSTRRRTSSSSSTSSSSWRIVIESAGGRIHGGRGACGPPHPMGPGRGHRAQLSRRPCWIA